MKLQISLLALAVAASTTASADWWGDQLDKANNKMVSDTKVVQDLQSNVKKNAAEIKAEEEARKKAIADEEKARKEALNLEKKEREEAIAKEAAIRAAEDDALVDLLIMEETERKEGDRQTLAAANAYTDQRVNKIEKHYKAAVASSIAIASLPQPTTAGKNMFSIGAGTWESEQGYALGVSGVTMDNKWVYKVAASGDSRGNFGGGASVGFQW